MQQLFFEMLRHLADRIIALNNTTLKGIVSTEKITYKIHVSAESHKQINDLLYNTFDKSVSFSFEASSSTITLSSFGVEFHFIKDSK